MNISIDLTQLINNEEKEALKKVLETNDETNLIEKLQKIGIAAMSEYLEMILGKQIPGKANEIKERRLYHLLKYYFENEIPNESLISSLFQLTEKGSCTLLRNVRTKFKYELETPLNNTIINLLITAEKKNGNYRVVIKSENILELLKHVVSNRAPRLEQISKVKNSAGVYNIPEDTFEELCSHYGIDLSEIDSTLN
jgi:hypothetical protein